MGEIHELFVLALSLVWFAGATPDCTLLNKGGCRRAFRLRGAGQGSFPLYGGTFARSYSVPIFGFGLPGRLLRDGGLSKSKEVEAKGLFPSFSGVPRCCSGPEREELWQ